MSQMSPKQRRQIIRENIIHHTTKEIAALCHVTKRTITRDIQKWKAEGGFEEFLMDEFLKSYPEIKEKFPDKAFDRLCYLLGKTMVQKREVQENLNVKSKHVEEVNIELRNYEATVQRVVNRYIPKESVEEQVDTA